MFQAIVVFAPQAQVLLIALSLLSLLLNVPQAGVATDLPAVPATVWI
jgi:hypothetical protein